MKDNGVPGRPTLRAQALGASIECERVLGISILERRHWNIPAVYQYQAFV